MIKKNLVIFIALSVRWPRSGASLSAKNAVFDDEDNIRGNQHGGYDVPRGGTTGFWQLDAGADNIFAVDPCENSQFLNITAPDHPTIDGCYILEGVTSLYGPAGRQYERASCDHGDRGSSGGMLVVRVQPLMMMHVRATRRI